MAGSTFKPGTQILPENDYVPPAPTTEPARGNKGLKMIPTLSMEDYEPDIRKIYDVLGIAAS